MVVELEMRGGKAARLLCAGLRVVAGEGAVSAGKVRAVILSPGAPAIRQVVSSATHPCRPRQGRGHAANVRMPAAAAALVLRHNVCACKTGCKAARLVGGTSSRTDGSDPAQFCKHSTHLERVWDLRLEDCPWEGCFREP